MNKLLAFYVMAACLGSGAGAWAHQPESDPAAKTANGKTSPAKKSSKAACSSMQGGVDASGAESIDAQAKTGQAKAAAGCGKDNGKASSPNAAPTTANPDVKRPTKGDPHA
ncbi:hypothetical protein [Duganella sp. BuS-21]|uniref:hypothetical protein n=1 Tax=Duganella sp. BuS-21 TaxID=2943848 RepID=UPI0035A6ECCA